MTLQEQAWASVSPANVLKELQGKHQLKVDGDKLIVTPPPGPRLAFQIRRYKPKLLELMGAGKTLAQRISEAQQKLGWNITTDDNYQQEERLAIATEGSHKGKAITFNLPEMGPEVEPPWETPAIIRQEYCQHQLADHYRVKVDGKAVVKLLCPDCGHNLKGPRRFTEPRKRSAVPWWPQGSKVVPDPDADTDALVEWWQSVENNVTDGCTFAQGIRVQNAQAFRATIDELIMLWKFGDPDLGLKAQLQAHKTYLESEMNP